MTQPASARAVFAISVAAELAGTGIQSLRQYEARGLITPQRTPGGTRRYSRADVDTVRRVGELLDAGLNLAGVAAVLRLEAENLRLRRRIAKLESGAARSGAGR